MFRLQACSPSVAHECNENSYLNSVCYSMTGDLQMLSTVTPVFQGQAHTNTHAPMCVCLRYSLYLHTRVSRDRKRVLPSFLLILIQAA